MNSRPNKALILEEATKILGEGAGIYTMAAIAYGSGVDEVNWFSMIERALL